VKVGKYTMSFAPKAAAAQVPAKPSEQQASAVDAGFGIHAATAVIAGKGNSSNIERRLTGNSASPISKWRRCIAAG
jgi:hypothetical protein